MEIVYLIFFFILGTCMGSFFTVVGYRLPEGGSIINPKRSYCPKCKHSLSFIELIPILSYIIQGGKCKNCKEKISIFYPIVEFLSGILFMLSYYSFGFTPDLIISITISSLLLVVLIKDINYLIIPDEVTIVAGVIIFICNTVKLGIVDSLYHLLYGLLMFGLMYLIMLLGNYLFKKESLGGADIKLMFIVGLTLGPVLGLVVIFIASFIALPVSLIFLLNEKEHVIPFGPFLVLALVLLFLMKIDVSMIREVIRIEM